MSRRAVVAASGMALIGAALPIGALPTMALSSWVPPAPPVTTAKAVFVYDATAGVALSALIPDEPLAPASLTKVATGVVALNLLDLAAMVTITEDDLASTDESRVGLVAGDVMSVYNLIAGMLVASGNDASKALARFAGQTVLGAAPGQEIAAFVDAMNAMAEELGLTQTHFENPSGLDGPGQFSSARDLAMLSVEAMKNPVFAEIVAMVSATLPSAVLPEGYPIHTTNDFLLDGYALGIKTGTTEEAGGCLITASLQGANLLITVVLGSELTYDEFGPHSAERFNDTRAILNYVSQIYTWVDPSMPGTVPSLDAEMAAWRVLLPPTGFIPVPNDALDDAFRLRLDAAESEVAGSLMVMAGTQVLTTRPLSRVS